MPDTIAVNCVCKMRNPQRPLAHIIRYIRRGLEQVHPTPVQDAVLLIEGAESFPAPTPRHEPSTPCSRYLDSAKALALRNQTICEPKGRLHLRARSVCTSEHFAFNGSGKNLQAIWDGV